MTMISSFNHRRSDSHLFASAQIFPSLNSLPALCEPLYTCNHQCQSSPISGRATHTASQSLKALSRFPVKLSLCWNHSLPLAFTSCRASGEVASSCRGRSSRYVRTAIPRPQSLSSMNGRLIPRSVQSLRSRFASPLRRSPTSTISIKFRNVDRTFEIKERYERSCLLSGPE
ncbi:hypothetical protein BJX65DRAFT_202058 [Aspergillus insuetus]